MLARAAGGDVEAMEAGQARAGGPKTGRAGQDKEQSVVKVLAGQRDRFKQKATDLEEDLRQVTNPREAWRICLPWAPIKGGDLTVKCRRP